MKMVFVSLLVFILAGCTTTPNNAEQWERKYQREDERDHKKWCLRNFGVWIEDTKYGNKCLRQTDYDRATRR